MDLAWKDTGQRMIESHLAKSGDLIFDVNRRQLCSHHDPRQEGKTWSERRVAEGLHAKHLIVLGAGCGYHIEALRQATNKKIYVIEASNDIMEACAKVHSMDFYSFNARYLPNVQALKESVWFQEAISTSYQVLVHKPSYFAHKETYEAMYEWLISRSWNSLTWMWEQRTRTHLVNQICPVLSTDQHPLSLKDVDNLVEKSPLRGKSRSWMIFRALRELIS